MSQVEVFTEVEWEDARLARQKRDDRLIELQAQGYLCTAENLQTIHSGQWVYVVRAAPPELAAKISVETSAASPTPSRVRPRPKTQPANYETC